MSKNKLTAILIAVLGIVAIVIGCITLSNDKKFIETKGVITDIRSEIESTSDGFEEKYTVYVKYTVDGREYEEELGSYSPSMEKNQEIEIKYNPQNPAQIQAKNVSIAIYLVVIGVVVILLGAFLFFKQR